MLQTTHEHKVEPLVSFSDLEFRLGRSRRDLEELAADAHKYYRPFDRRREAGRGKWRHIDNPIGELKKVQGLISERILASHPLPANMLGGRQGRTIKDNAQIHLNARFLLTLDLKSCFPKTHDLSIFKVFLQKIRCSSEIASLLTKLTTFQHRLPQGSPASLALANLSLLDMFYDIEEIISVVGLALSFWVDDIAISGDERVYEIVDEVVRVIAKHGHAVSRKKFKLTPCHRAQRLTGTMINRKLSVGRDCLNEVRRLIISLAEHDEIFDDQLRRIDGKIGFVAFISGVQGENLRRLRSGILPKIGADRGKTRLSETRPCTRSRRHRLHSKTFG